MRGRRRRRYALCQQDDDIQRDKYTTCVLWSTAASQVLDLDSTTVVAAGTLDGNIYAQETPIVVRRLPLQLSLQLI